MGFNVRRARERRRKVGDGSDVILLAVVVDAAVARGKGRCLFFEPGGGYNPEVERWFIIVSLQQLES